MGRMQSALGAGVSVLIVVGVSLGFGISHWNAEAPSNNSPASGTAAMTDDPSRTALSTDSGPPPVATKSLRRALLIGVTRYDNPKFTPLSGPANDVRLMRDLLQQSYGFPAEAVVSLTQDEGRPDLRPTRANIVREFHRLADQVREGDQILILMAGHGARQPADPDDREPDGIDEVFLPSDTAKWRGFPDKCPNALADKELGRLLQSITVKKARVWIIFDCCHSGTMTRGVEVPRELPPGVLVPEEELDKARARAAQREKTRGAVTTKTPAFVPREPSDYLVALYACRETEVTPESNQPPEAPNAPCHGLLTYSVVDILTKSAASKAPLTYRELVQRLQVRYAARPQGSPTPLLEGKGQDLVVLGAEEPSRPRLLLSRDGKTYKVNAGDLYGLTRGTILGVYSPAGTDVEPRLLGYVRVAVLQPTEATVEPCAYDQAPIVRDFPPLSTCQSVAVDYGRERFKVYVQLGENRAAERGQILKAIEPLTGAKDGMIDLVDDLRQAQWLIQIEKNDLRLVEASGNRAPFALPAAGSPELAAALRRNMGQVFRARSLISVASRFEDQRQRDKAALDVEVEVLRHDDAKARGEVLSRPANGWVFRPGDFISFRIKNKSPSLSVDVTLLIVGSDFEIHPFYPKKGELAKSLPPGQSIDTPPPPGQIGDEPPFGPECLVVIAVPAKNPPVDFSALEQDGLARARAADGSNSLQSPLGELLESALFRTSTRGPLRRTVVQQYGMRVLTWRTEPQ